SSDLGRQPGRRAGCELRCAHPRGQGALRAGAPITASRRGAGTLVGRALTAQGLPAWGTRTFSDEGRIVTAVGVWPISAPSATMAAGAAPGGVSRWIT